METSRRALLTAAPALAFVATAPVIAANFPADRSRWNAAMAAYERAKAESDAYDPIFAALCQQEKEARARS